MKGNAMTFTTYSAEQTEALGAAIARATCDKRSFIALYGEMGAGKTAFVRGLASVLSPGSRAKSPTYTLVNEYLRGETPLFHFDLCRLSSADELDSFGFYEYADRGHVAVEWADLLGGDLPPGAICVHISRDGDRRVFDVEGLDGEIDFETEAGK